MADIKLPMPTEGKNDKETIMNLQDTVMKLRKELEYILQNLDESNVVRAQEVVTNWVYGGDVNVDQIAQFDEVVTNKIGAVIGEFGYLTASSLVAIRGEFDQLIAVVGEFDGLIANKIDVALGNFQVVVTQDLVTNTFITNNLTARNGYIADLTVDKIDTSTKVYNYLHSNISKVKYIRASGQELEFVEAVTDGNSTDPVYDRSSNRLYWTDVGKTNIGTTLTQYPVTIYRYTETVMFKISNSERSQLNGSWLPVIEWCSENAGVGESGKSWILNDTTGMEMTYINGIYTQKLINGDNGITVSNVGTATKSLRNISISDTPPTNPDLNDIWIDPSAELPRGDEGEAGIDGTTPVKGVDYFDGEPGADGATPVKGVDYFDGANGTDGSVWHSDEGVPSDALGVNTDHYLNVSNGDVYEKLAGTWGSAVGNIKGIQGVQGIQGESSGQIFWFGHTGSDIATYEEFLRTPSTGVEEDKSITCTNANTEYLIDAYATKLGSPATTKIPSGLWYFDVYAYASAGGTQNIVFRVFKRDSGGTETELFNVTSAEIGTTLDEFTTQYTQVSDIVLSTTDRLIVKIYAKSSSAGKVVHFLYQGTSHTSHVHTPLYVQGAVVPAWRNGAGVPSDTLGNNGDYYLNDTNDDVYTKELGTWGSAVANIKGATGTYAGNIDGGSASSTYLESQTVIDGGGA